MRRIVHVSALATSLVIALGAGVLWARSYTFFDTFHQRLRRSQLKASTAPGVLEIGLFEGFPPVPPSHFYVPMGRYFVRQTIPPKGDAPPGWFSVYPRSVSWRLLGFAAERRVDPPTAGSLIAGAITTTRTTTTTATRVVVPLWFVVAVASSAPLASAIRQLRPRRAAHACRACGYDLRASPERCPECGANVVAASRTS